MILRTWPNWARWKWKIWIWNLGIRSNWGREYQTGWSSRATSPRSRSGLKAGDSAPSSSRKKSKKLEYIKRSEMVLEWTRNKALGLKRSKQYWTPNDQAHKPNSLRKGELSLWLLRLQPWVQIVRQNLLNRSNLAGSATKLFQMKLARIHPKLPKTKFVILWCLTNSSALKHA